MKENYNIFNSAVLLENGVNKVKVKNFADTYLYNKGNYEKAIFDFIMHTDFVDKKNESFQDLRNDIKRQRISNSLSKVLDSDKTLLCISDNAMPRAFKVFVGKDLRSGSNELKLFIDVTGLIKIDNGQYVYSNNDLQIIISYLTAGMNMMIYYADPSKITNKNGLIESGARCFADLVFYICDYLRLSADITTRDKIKYLASKYFQLCLLNMEYTEAVENRARKIAQISEQQVTIIDLNLSKVKNPYKDISTFTEAIKAVLKSDKFSVELFVDKWMYNIGNGSQFGLELYTSFASQMIYAYIGAYLNNQKTIEKAAGRDMVDFVVDILKLGEEVIK